MQDAFTGRPTRLRGGILPGPSDGRGLQDDHRGRLEALARLGALAAECGVAADPDRDLVTLPEDELSLLERGEPNSPWSRLGAAIREWRRLVPLKRLEDFGFPPDADNPLEESSPRLKRIGGGVEAWAYEDEEGTVYKFYLPIEGGAKRVGSAFGFRSGSESALLASARPGTYRDLLEKLLIIEALGGMPTEVVAVTPEGVLVAKQARGNPLQQGDDVSEVLPAGLLVIPSRFLRADRDHPRLLFLDGRPYLVADLHARNFVRAADRTLRVIDLVAAAWPEGPAARDPLIAGWMDRVRSDPAAPALPSAPDGEL